MQNLDSVAQKMSELCSIYYLAPAARRLLHRAVPPVTNLRIELRTSRQLKSQKYQVSEISGIKNVGYQKYQVSEIKY